jgi:hypothetical protein
LSRQALLLYVVAALGAPIRCDTASLRSTPRWVLHGDTRPSHCVTWRRGYHFHRPSWLL